MGWWWPEVIPACGVALIPRYAGSMGRGFEILSVYHLCSRQSIPVSGSYRADSYCCQSPLGIHHQKAARTVIGQAMPLLPIAIRCRLLSSGPGAFHPGGCRSFHPHQPRYRSLLCESGPGPCTRLVVPFAGAFSIGRNLSLMRMRVSWLSPFCCWPASFWWSGFHRRTKCVNLFVD